jgi:dienelactone hydrolase
MNRHDVKFESDANVLNGWLYKLSNESDPAPAVIWNHGDGKGEASPPDELAAAFNEKGFVVFAPVRRFQDSELGAPADGNKPKNWEKKHELDNRDVFNALDWLRSKAFVDPKRIVISGFSGGAVQTILSVARGGPFRAGVAFGGGAKGWDKSEEPLKKAVLERKLPLFILQAKNDVNLYPVEKLGPLLEKSDLLHKKNVYPAFGKHGHSDFPLHGASVWGRDVFGFIHSCLSNLNAHGRPKGTYGGQGKRYQLWQDEEGWHLRTLSDGQSEHHFRGSIHLDGGSFASVHAVLAEHKDRWLVSPDLKDITFDFVTKAEDGLSFVVHNRHATLSFDLELGGQAPKFDPGRIFVGQKGHHPIDSPFDLPAG